MRLSVFLVLILGCGSGTATQTTTETNVDEPVAVAPVAVAPVAAATGSGTLTTETFHSDALGVDKAYLLYRPASYAQGDTRYPVVYMLHGLGGDEDDWSKMGLVEAADDIGLQAIVVMLDGDDSFYANSKTDADYDACLLAPRKFGRAASLATYCVRKSNYEDYVVNDMVRHVDATYRTIPKREARAIGGLSMGGFGALMIGMRHKDMFSSVASHSGVTALLYKGAFPYEAGKTELASDPKEVTLGIGVIGTLLMAIFGDDIGNWRTHDPATLAQSLQNGELAIYLDCGTEDEFRLQNGASYLHEVLTARGVIHDFSLTPGGHNARFWADRIDDSLRFHSRHFAALDGGSKDVSEITSMSPHPVAPGKP